MHRLKLIFNVEHLIVAALAGLILLFLWTVALKIKFLNPITQAIENFSLSDLYYEAEWTSDEPPQVSDKVTLLNVTTHRRGDIAAVLKKLDSYHPAAVGVDFLFPNYNDDDAEGDYALALAADSMSNTVFACYLKDRTSTTGPYSTKVTSYFDSNGREACVNMGVPPRACMREFALHRVYRNDTIPSFPTALAQIYRGAELPAANDAKRRINFRHLTFPIIDADSIDHYAHLLSDRIVVVGCVEERADSIYTPIDVMSGAEMWCYAVQTLVEQRDIKPAPTLWQGIYTAFCCYIIVLLLYGWTYLAKRSSSPMAIFLLDSRLVPRFITFGWLALIAWGSYIAYERRDIYIPLTVTITMVALVGEARNIYIALISALTNRHNPQNDNWLTRLAMKSIY